MVRPRLPYKYQEPVRSGYCGPASLAMALASIGIELGQDLLALWAGFDSVWGTDYDGLKRVAGQFSWPQIVAPASLSELSLIAPLRPVIVNWMTGPDCHEDGHYSLLDRVDGDSLTLMDPDVGFRTLKTIDFEANWWDMARTGRVDRWAMVLNPSV